MKQPSGKSLNSVKTIKELVESSKLFESRFVSELYGFDDLYRLPDPFANDGILWFLVRRGSYERIKWMSIDEAALFSAHAIIDEIIKEEKESDHG